MYREIDDSPKIFKLLKKKWFWPVLFIGLFLFIWACRYTQIKTGNVGVKTVMGQVQMEELAPGVYFPLPFVQSIREYSTKEIAVSLSDMRPKTKNNLTMEDVDVACTSVSTLRWWLTCWSSTRVMWARRMALPLWVKTV
jgi:regulator of protease activity HflC (stomatin/prohibitin superfamily)